MTSLTLRKMSSFVFDLTPDYQNIIRYLAEHGSGNITKISQFTKNSEDYPLDRWAVKKRIYGSSCFQSLLDRGYLVEKIEDKHRYKKNEKTFYLTSKGILASFRTTSLKNNIAFRNVIDFANYVTKGTKQRRFIQEFITSQIKYYLAYLYVQGIQLTWQNDTWQTYRNFLDNSENGLNLEIKNKEIMLEFRKIFEEYVVLRSVYHYLGGKVPKYLADNTTNLWRYIDDSKLPTIHKEKKSWESFVMGWFASPQSQIPTQKEFWKIKQPNIPKFTDDEHMFSRLNILEKRLTQKLRTLS
mgnify:CR=1 FL=1|jgi:hypothetical protein